MTASFTWNIPLTFQANNQQAGVAVNISVSIGQPYISNINGKPIKSPEQEKYDRQREWDDWLEQERIIRQQQQQIEQQRRIYDEEIRFRLREEEKKIKRQNDEISKVNWKKEGF